MSVSDQRGLRKEARLDRLKAALRVIVPAAVYDLYDLICFLFVQQIRGFDVPSEPHFDPQSLPYFRERLGQARNYLEYGSGGSTIWAARLGKTFTTVDSDPVFLDAVRRKVGAEGFAREAGQTYFHADIGWTKAWGIPVFTNPALADRRKWESYAAAPWAGDGAMSRPDLILIDGRFRVACALTSIRNLKGCSDWEILFDDYVDRPEYRGVEEFAVLERTIGRMAVFKMRDGLDDRKLDEAIERFVLDWR